MSWRGWAGTTFGTSRTGEVDVVYVVREGDDNEELRYSLRSLRNVPHGQVWIVGYCPSFVKNVNVVPSPQHWSKYVNSTRNVLAACKHPDVSDRFLLFNDDFFILRRVDEWPVFHRGPVADVVADYYRRFGPLKWNDHYRRGMEQTAAILERWGFADPLSYELHAPMAIQKDLMVEAVMRAVEEDSSIVALHKRTLFGNYARVGGRATQDHKMSGMERTWGDNQLFVSTEDSAFRRGAVGRRLRARFPEPSPYER